MAENETTFSMKERLRRVKEQASFQRLRGFQAPRLGVMGWAGLLLAVVVSVWMVREAEEDKAELEPLLVTLYSERGMEPPSGGETQQDAGSALPENWQERFQPRRKEYPLDDLNVKADSRYKRMERYEHLPRVLKSAPEKKLTVREDHPSPDTTHIYEKDLVLAGRGYEIGRFQPQPGLGLQLNTLSLPEAKTVPFSDLPDYGRKSFVPGSGDSRNRVIFHAKATGIPPRVSLEEPMEPPPEKTGPVEAEPHPKTRLVLKANHEPLLLLNPGPEKAVDLLNGHPAVNRHLLEQREQRGK